MEPVTRRHFEHLLRRIDSSMHQTADSERTPHTIDIHKWYLKIFMGEARESSGVSNCNRFNLLSFDVIGDMAFGSPLGFLSGGKDQQIAMTAEGKDYVVASLINMLHKGVRYNLALCQLLSLSMIRLLKVFSKCNHYLYKLTNAKSADDFTDVAIYQVRKV